MKKFLLIVFIITLPSSLFASDINDLDSYELKLKSGDKYLTPLGEKKELITNKVIELMNTCWFNDVTEPKFSKEINKSKFRKTWDDVKEENHLYISLVKPIKLDEYVGGMYVSEILISSGEPYIILSRYRDEIINYRKCNGRLTIDFMCMDETRYMREPYLTDSMCKTLKNSIEKNNSSSTKSRISIC